MPGEIDKEEQTNWKHLKHPGVAITVIGIILMIISLVAFQKWVQTINSGFLFGFIAMVCGIMIVMAEQAMKNLSPKVVCQNFVSTITPKDIFAKGNWTLIRLGGIFVKGFPVIEGSDGVLVVPSTGVNPMGNSMAVTVIAQTTNYKELPLDAQELISQHKFKPPYYLGIASEEQMLRENINVEGLKGLKQVDLKTYSVIFRSQNSLISDLKDISTQGFQGVEDFTAYASRISQIADKKTLRDRLADKLAKRKDDY